MSRSPSRYGWCGAASSGTCLNHPMNDCGSLTRALMSTMPARRDLSSRFPAGRQLRHAGDAPAPGRRRRRVEADVVDDRRRRVDVWLAASAGAKRVQQHLPAVAGEVELGQVDVPGALRRPADELTGAHPVAALDARVDVPVAEVADADAAAGAGGDAASTTPPSIAKTRCVRPAGSARRRPVVPHGDVDAGVVDRAERRNPASGRGTCRGPDAADAGARPASRGSRRCSAAGTAASR